MFAKLIAALAAAAMPPPTPAPTPTLAPQADRPACLQRYSARICGMPSLAPLRAEIAHKFAAVIATGNRTATWRARHAAALRDLKAGVDYDGQPLSDDDLAERFRDHLHDLDTALAQAQGARPLIKIPSAHSATCMATWLDQGCRVAASGMLRADQGRVIYWQMMDGASRQDGIGAGIILWAATGHGTAKAIGWSFDGVHFEPPRVTQGGMIWVPGRRIGSGNGNADLLFAWDEKTGAWQDIELESWRDDLPAKLPRGFGIWKGVDYDFEGMGAFSKLWRDRDGNCCPSGGDAILDFEIDGRRLKLTQLRADIVEKWARQR